jgi:hypothetical protein
MKFSLFIILAITVAINAAPVEHHRSKRQLANNLAPLSRLPETAVHALGGPGFGFGFGPGILGMGGMGGFGGMGIGSINALGMAGFGLPFGYALFILSWIFLHVINHKLYKKAIWYFV